MTKAVDYGKLTSLPCVAHTLKLVVNKVPFNFDYTRGGDQM